MILLLATALAGHPVSATTDMVSGTSDEGRWGVQVTGGYPWSGLRAQGGIAPRVTLFGEMDTALFRRFQPSVGVAGRLLDGKIGRISAEAALGWQIQVGQLPQRGPTAVVRLRGMLTGGRVTAFVYGSARLTLLPDRTRVITPEGESVQWTVRQAWTPAGYAGIAVRAHEMVGLELGLGWRAADLGTFGFSLPSFHLGVHVGGPT